MTGRSHRRWRSAGGLPPHMRLRPLGPEDLDAVVALEKELFGGEAWSREMLASEIAAATAPVPDRCYLAVEHTGDGGDADAVAGRIIGYAGLWFGDGRGNADLLSIATAAPARRRGVASAMLSRLLDVAREAGCHAVLLEVRASNRGAQALYARFGFEIIGTRRRYYLAPVEDAVVMRLGLSDGRGPGVVGAERF